MYLNINGICYMDVRVLVNFIEMIERLLESLKIYIGMILSFS